MTLTLVKNLETVCPVDNPKLIVISTDNQYSTSGVHAERYIRFSQTDEDPGRDIILQWSGYSIEMVLAVTPDDSGHQMHTATPGQTLQDWVAVLCDDLNANYYLSRDFMISVYDLTAIHLMAREPGDDFYIILLNTSNTIEGLTADPAPVHGVEPVLRDFYNLILQVKPHDSETLLGQDMVPPDLDGQCAFDIYDLLCDYLTPEFEWPHETGVTHVPRAEFIKKFRVQYAETLAEFLISFKAFLTWQPFLKRITTAQPEMLFYLVFNDIANIYSFVKIYYTDGTASANTQIATFTVAQYEVHEFFTDYIALDIAAKLPSGKTCLKYDFWLQDKDSNIISQVRTYEIEFRPQRYSRIFIFRNSFGAYDIFLATGRKKHSNKYEKMLIERNLNEYTVAEQYQILESESFQVSSGHVSRTTKNWLRELMLSEEVFEILGDYKFPILIENEELEFGD